MKTVLVDLDHTISDALWRDEMILNGDSWDDYHAASFFDKPIPEMASLVRALRWTGYELIAITSRPQKWHKLTLQWLAKYNIPIDEILMRPPDDFRPSPELKLGMIKKYYLKDIAFIIEDREDVCQAFREAGVTALQCHARKM